MNWILFATPYTSALCFASSILFGSTSIAMTGEIHVQQNICQTSISLHLNFGSNLFTFRARRRELDGVAARAAKPINNHIASTLEGRKYCKIRSETFFSFLFRDSASRDHSKTCWQTDRHRSAICLAIPSGVTLYQD